jgi:DNA-binding GntR family transcriptional regulator
LADFADRHPDDSPRPADPARSRMLEALGILDAETTLLSAPLLTVSARAAAHRLQQAAAECAAAANSRQFADLSGSFHRTLVSTCPNQRMLGLLAEEITLVRALLDADPGPGPEELSRAAHEHALLLQLVETAPSSPDIASLLREHRQICY